VAAAMRGKITRLLDSAASEHYDPDLANFKEISTCEPYPIEVANGEFVYSTKIGRIEFSCISDGKTKVFSLSKVYYTPQMPCPLISIGRLREDGVIFSNEEGDTGNLKLEDGTVILRVPMSGNRVYPLETWRPSSAASAQRGRKVLTIMEAHRRLGHIAPEAVKHAVSEGFLAGFDVDLSSSIEDCAACLKGKFERTAIAKKRKLPRSRKSGDLVHSDVWGPAQTVAKGGYRYYSDFTDDHSRYSLVFLQKSKAETF
jgi:GAG-pre-integrase domain